MFLWSVLAPLEKTHLNGRHFRDVQRPVLLPRQMSRMGGWWQLWKSSSLDEEILQEVMQCMQWKYRLVLPEHSLSYVQLFLILRSILSYRAVFSLIAQYSLILRNISLSHIERYPIVSRNDPSYSALYTPYCAIHHHIAKSLSQLVIISVVSGNIPSDTLQ